MSAKKVEEFEEFEEDVFGDTFPKEVNTEKDIIESQKKRIAELEAEIQEKTEIKEVKKMARKGANYLVLRATSYHGKTLQADQVVSIADTNVTNKWLKKIKEYSIDEGFHEELNGQIKNLVMEDGEKKSGYDR